MSPFFKSRLFRILEALVVAIALSFAFFKGIEGVPLHGDESHWVSTSYFLETFLSGYPGPAWMKIEGVPANFKAPSWVARALDGGPHPGAWSAYYWTLTQPPMTRYLIGIGRLLGGYSPGDLNLPWNFSLNPSLNRIEGRAPSPGLLLSARSMMAFLAVASGLLLFLLLRRGAGPVAAYAFLLLFACSGFLLIHLRRAMSESPLLIFTAATLALGALALSKAEGQAPRDKRRAIVYLSLAGIAAGFAGAVKLNALALAATLPAFACAIAWMRRKTPDAAPVRTGLALWVLPLFLSAAAFIAINPFLYPNPPARAYAMFLFRLWEMRGQAQNPQWFIPNLSARLGIIPRRVLMDYALVKVPILNAALMAAGMYAAGRSAWRWLAGKAATAAIRPSSASLALILAACVSAIPPLFTPLDWDRYYLYPVVFGSMFIAIGIAWCARIAMVLANRLKKAVAKPDTPWYV
jgi:peptidoglycan/LPS O-acetylase OafA/YrhL